MAGAARRAGLALVEELLGHGDMVAEAVPRIQASDPKTDFDGYYRHSPYPSH